MRVETRGIRGPQLVRGVVAGALGGLVASWMMNVFLAGSSKAQEALKEPSEQEHDRQEVASAGDDSTQKVADAVSQAVADHPLSHEEKQTAGPAVHYIFGSLMGAVYGGLAEYLPATTLGLGTVFGSALFLGADAVAVPALGLSKPPSEEPTASQANHWAAHLVYGVTVDLVRRGARRIL